MKMIQLAILFLVCVSLWSCSKGNDSSTTLDTTGKHPALWVVPATGGLHPAEYTANPGNCAECHGSDLKGGVVNVSCSSTSFGGISCHPGGPGHGAGFASAGLHGVMGKADLGYCQLCHATPSSGANPRFNVAKPNIPNGCETCHKVNTAHPTPWLIGRVGTPNNVANTTSHSTAGKLATTCALCHGAALDGVGAGVTAPSCMSATAIGGISCHATSPVANPTGCTSCHGNPPPTNKHGAHFTSIPNLTCAACHYNLGPGTATHAAGTANVALSPIFLAKTGGAVTFNADGTCSNVSCHGGKQSPSWTSVGTFDITVCANCHALGTTQYNSYNSGEHQTHVVDVGLSCNQCHDTAKLGTNSNHFTHLETSAMEGPASATVGGGSTKVASYLNRSCTPSDTRDFPTGTCHATRTW